MSHATISGLAADDTTDFVCGAGNELPLSPAAHLLARLLDAMVLLPEEWDELPGGVRADLLEADRVEHLLPRLVDRHLLTRYQAEAVAKGRLDDLIVGHYRLLEPVGRGGMGVVFRAEHLHLRRPVALKLMANGFEDNPRLLRRFFLEARAVARLKHPHLVACLDAGRHHPPDGAARSYYVMELIPGADLAARVLADGPLPVHQAAGIFRQVADALAEAHRHRLIHRDIKPSNILVTPDGEGKLLDFGLALHPHRQMTDPGTLLGTVGYMAPEQAVNPSGVDARADLFSLGASLFLAVSGREPFPETGAAISDLTRRLTCAPPRVRGVRPELPAELDDLIAKLMDPNPDRRLPTAAAVSAALAPLQRWRPEPARGAGPGAGGGRRRVLVVDDDPAVRAVVRELLAGECDCTEAADGAAAWDRLAADHFDLAVVDLAMPGLDGARLVERVRTGGADPGLKMLLMSGQAPAETLGGLLLAGADDFIQKPFSLPELRSRVRGLLARRERESAGGSGPKSGHPAAPATARMARLGAASDTMRMPLADLQRPAGDSGLVDFDLGADWPAAPEPASAGGWDSTAAEALAATVSRVLEEANQVGRGHGRRLPRYLRALAADCPAAGEYARLHDPAYLDMLTAVLPLHDLGHLVLPTDLLQKTGRLTADERMVMQTHTTAGSEVVVDVAARYAGALPYLTLAAEVVRSHHERWDGQGYPDLLGGTAVPLAARAAAVVTVYDALRSRRPHRPGLTHPRAVRVIAEESPGQFDPTLVAAFRQAAGQFDQIFQQYAR